eukprot:2501491-Pyramimonas_sp.AAC.1
MSLSLTSLPAESTSHAHAITSLGQAQAHGGPWTCVSRQGSRSAPPPDGMAVGARTGARERAWASDHARTETTRRGSSTTRTHAR